MFTIPSTTSDEAFTIFFKNWLIQQQILLKQLLLNCNENTNTNSSLELITKVLSHYADYYDHKSKIIQENIFVLFSPPWLTPFEKPFLWLTGFKPSTAFAIILASVSDMNPEQSRRIRSLKAQTLREERDLMDAFATVQESIGSPPMLILIRKDNANKRVSDGGVSDEFDVAMQAMKHSMSEVVQSADDLRRNTVMKMVDVLNVNQNVKFLGAVIKYQFLIRNASATI